MLAWPRADADGTPLGVDLRAKAGDIRRIVQKHFRAPDGEELEDLVQSVLLAIATKNGQAGSAFDPRRSSFGHYVFVVARSTAANLARAARRAGELLEDELELEDEHDAIALVETVHDVAGDSDAPPLWERALERRRCPPPPAPPRCKTPAGPRVVRLEGWRSIALELGIGERATAAYASRAKDPLPVYVGLRGIWAARAELERWERRQVRSYREHLERRARRAA